MIISIFILSVLAVPLANIPPRQGPYSRILPAIILYFVYYSLLKTSVNWIKNDSIPYWLGLWWVHMSFILIAIALYGKQSGWLKRIFPWYFKQILKPNN